MWFLFHFPDRHAKFWNMVAFPMAPVGFAQTCRHRVAFLLDRDHQVVFFCLIARVFKKHPECLVGTLGDQDRVARFDVDGLPRLVQIQAEGFLHNGPFSVLDPRLHRRHLSAALKLDADGVAFDDDLVTGDALRGGRG
jgi:hypothetical protein